MGALLKLATAFIGIRGRIPQLKKLSWKDIATFADHRTHLIGSLFSFSELACMYYVYVRGYWPVRTWMVALYYCYFHIQPTS